MVLFGQPWRKWDISFGCCSFIFMRLINVNGTKYNKYFKANMKVCMVFCQVVYDWWYSGVKDTNRMSYTTMRGRGASRCVVHSWLDWIPDPVPVLYQQRLLRHGFGELRSSPNPTNWNSLMIHLIQAWHGCHHPIGLGRHDHGQMKRKSSICQFQEYPKTLDINCKNQFWTIL